MSNNPKNQERRAKNVVKSHVLWSIGAGLMPIPLFDIAAVTAIQIDLLRQLSELFDVNFTRSSGKAFVTALTGSTFAKIGSSFVKALPGIGSIIGGVSMSVLSGASTYGIGQVAIAHFKRDGNFEDIDTEWAKRAYEDAYEKGKEFVSGIEKKRKSKAKDVFESLQELGDLRDKGIITEEEFEQKKRELLDKL